MTTSKAKAKRRIQRKNGFFLCPHEGCIWRSKVLSSVSRHRSSHSITPKFVCEDCGAANMRADSHERHVDTCLKDRRANLMRKGKPPKFSTANQFRQAFPLAEEEEQQVLMELTDQLQRENQDMRLELIRKDETIAGLERQLGAGRADHTPLMVEDNDMIISRQSKELSPSSSPPSSPPLSQPNPSKILVFLQETSELKVIKENKARRGCWGPWRGWWGGPPGWPGCSPSPWRRTSPSHCSW